MGATDLELAAWRFLAVHRVNGLSVTHVTFVTDGDVCRVDTPAPGDPGFYECAEGSTFGEAAIALAGALGMKNRLRAMERVVAGVVERRCNKCQGWFPRNTGMRKDANCTLGFANECLGCARDRKSVARAKKTASGTAGRGDCR